MKKLSGLSGVILAGGKNRRMGGVNKSLLPFAECGRLVELQLFEMNKICDEILLITNTPEDFGFLANSNRTVAIKTDLNPGSGPLSGLEAAAAYAAYPVMWVVAGDQPFLSATAAGLMLRRQKESNSSAAIPVIEGKHQMLHAIYDRTCGFAAGRLLQRGERRLSALLQEMQWTMLTEVEFAGHGISQGFACDVDTPEQYETAIRKFSMFHHEQQR